MKPIIEILSDDKPKNVAKITKASEKGGCNQYLSSFLAEIQKPTATDFPKEKILVTDSYICYYGLFGGAIATGTLNIYAIDQVANVYRCNIYSDGEYDYDRIHLAIEFKNGHKQLVSSVIRKAKTFTTVYAEVITFIRNRISIMGV